MALSVYGRKNVEKLKHNPIAALDAYYKMDLSRWRMCEHKQIIARRREQIRRRLTPIQIVADSNFIDGIYGMTRAWGLHRGPIGFVGKSKFKSQIKQAEESINSSGLKDIHIEYYNYDLDYVIHELWSAIRDSRFRVNDRIYIVPSSKVICHLIPDLLPPMDSGFTADFFGISGAKMRGEPKDKYLLNAFQCVFEGFIDLSDSLSQDQEFMDRIGKEFNTSIPKTIDNAIIGFMKLEEKSNKRQA